MATNAKTPAPEQAAKSEIKQTPRKAIHLHAGKTEEESRRNYAELMLSPELAAFRVLDRVERSGAHSKLWEGADVPALINQLREQATAANQGNLAQTEAMLMNQATALQSLFSRLAERAMGCEHAPAFDSNMRMALRAQNQCRATLETLAAIKNPPVIFAKQANINHGNQQVNNGIPAPAPRTEKIKNEPNQLLEGNHGSKKLDTSTTSRTGRKDQAMATMD